MFLKVTQNYIRVLPVNTKYSGNLWEWEWVGTCTVTRSGVIQEVTLELGLQDEFAFFRWREAAKLI